MFTLVFHLCDQMVRKRVWPVKMNYYFCLNSEEFIDMCTKGDNAHKSKKTSASDSTSKNSNMLYISSLNQQEQIYN